MLFQVLVHANASAIMMLRQTDDMNSKVLVINEHSANKVWCAFRRYYDGDEFILAQNFFVLIFTVNFQIIA